MRIHRLGGERAQGFAALSKADRAAIASLGGKAAHAQGTAHTFSHAEAVAAGRKGGRGNKKRRAA